jgi:hypothetical protein
MSVIFKNNDYKKILFELFSKANDKDCKITIDFLKDNVKLLKKTVGENNYGIPAGSTALHILAKKEFDYFLVSAYSSQTFFRNIYSDIETIITCLHENMGDKEFFNKLKELNIVNKTDTNGKTVSDIVDEILLIETDADVRKKYQKLKDVVEQIKGTLNGTLKGTLKGTLNGTLNGTSNRTESDNLFKLEIEKDSNNDYDR